VRTKARAARILEQLLRYLLATVTEQLDASDVVVLVHGDANIGRCGRAIFLLRRVADPFLADEQEDVVHVRPVAIH
jgi:hypothetical protein